jgi:outer membrane immunogenic protein
MKKLVLALTALAAFSGSALAADLPARTYSKAPIVVPPAPSWTGFYIFGGGGGGLWTADNSTVSSTTGLVTSGSQRMGGSGWFGTVGAGYDWQFNSTWVAGILADGQFGSLRGNINDTLINFSGSEKLNTTYAAGVRLGYLVAPNVLSYVNGGYSGSQWSGSTLTFQSAIIPAATTTGSFTRNGFFVGGGVENNLDIFGINIPGLFMKTEYRAAYYGTQTLPEVTSPPSALNQSITFKPWTETVSTSLVYRFNWTGAPVSARY